MNANIPEHAHCEICQRPITVGNRFCGSEECAERHEQNIRERKRQMWLFLAVIAAIMVFSVFSRF